MTATPGSWETGTEFNGTQRFLVKKRLGSGGFGVVYKVLDLEQQRTLALKLLRIVEPEALFRFKTEFRSLVEIHHANLVRLYELFSESGKWFFTMEFIDGQDFLEYLRPEGKLRPVGELRFIIRELVEGLTFLHTNRRVHRDIKPSNILVTPSGRPVLLDFGLIRDLNAAVRDQSVSMVGTPAYMSPEQLRRKEITPASDWYSLGVVLYQAFTDTMPAVRDPVYHLHEPLVPPSLFWTDIPADLNTLCCELLDPNPERRPGPERILRLLGVTANRKATTLLPGSHVFIGRTTQLELLNKCFAQTQTGQLSVVLIEGKSGIGKSALIRRFIETLSSREPRAVIFKGRCREFESVPYKGIDSIIDDLAGFLQCESDSSVQALLPRDAFLLPKLFPTLGRVKQIERSPVFAPAIPDAQELRQRTFSSLRELLARFAVRTPLAIWIDDWQWRDRDSSLLLAELCARPDPPPLLLLLSYRTESSGSKESIDGFRNFLALGDVDLGRWQHLLVDGLAANESIELLRALVGVAVERDVEEKIVHEAAGHPLFLQELARLATDKDFCSGAGSTFGLRAVLKRRVVGLRPLARELLELTCLASHPVSGRALIAAAQFEDTPRHDEILGLLSDQNLIQVAAGGTDRTFEPYHDQIRTVVSEMMNPEQQRNCHAQLARALALDAAVEPQQIMTHLKESGNIAAAFVAALKAAISAESQLAFERATAFYETAISLAENDNRVKADLYRRLADSLAKAGRGRDSAQSYVKAAELDYDRAQEMKLLAIDQLMRSGYVDEALESFHALARQFKIRTVHSPSAAVIGIMLGRIAIRSKLLFTIRTSPSRADSRDLRKLALLRTGGVVLAGVDPVAATYYQVAYISEALKLKDPSHLAQALAFEASLRVAGGARSVDAASDLLANAERIATASGDLNAIGSVRLCRAYVDYLLGLIPDGIRHCSAAISFLRERCTGVAWELTSAYVLLFWFKCWGGEVRDVRSLLPQLLKEGAARGDVNVEVSLRLLSYVHYSYLSADEPDLCAAECDKAIEKWSRSGFHLQHYGALFVQVETALYQAKYTEARLRLKSIWPVLSRSLILRWRILKVMALFLRGRTSLACWLNDTQDRQIMTDVDYCAKALERIQSDWTKPMALVLRAGLTLGNGNAREASNMLADAEEGFRRISLNAFASAVAYIRSRLVTEPGAESSFSSAVEFLHAEGVRTPEAFIRMLIPGRWF